MTSSPRLQSNHSDNLFKISDYLRDFDKLSNRGKCRACQKLVPWSKERLSGHKRASCPAVSEEEKRKFAKISIENINTFISIDNSESNAENHILTEEQSEKINANLANFFFRNGISLLLADSEAFKDFVHSLNPIYAKTMMNSKALSEQECHEINDHDPNGLLSDIDDDYFDGELNKGDEICGKKFVKPDRIEKHCNQHQGLKVSFEINFFLMSWVRILSLSSSIQCDD